ncbi:MULTISPECIES: GIY-YIG nuclease family protein [unclassified Methanoculleus]|jgi:Uri superfamily endonuclease|uniref:GIY-YIG nuclease family protein n=1 Tax=Methanoculleus palmolei TaxID=72612 RepID=A0ABD8AAB0_9EURY|nr:GIY-YIG nuclease family protein [Methanoculleus sp. UBA377]MDD2472729.1 GIY-YIG nuclease family protein [Methanoculleus sp.]WOX56461.1 GIY-YIG nuclease family protein [Methanoculleus palmolei]
MDKGVYALILENPRCEVRIGAPGTREFSEGRHIYVGSAQGSGGLARVNRHVNLAFLRDRQPRWHIDRLLLDPRFTLAAAVTAVTDRDCECDLARAVGGSFVPGFGCSDCTCPSHLFYRPGDPVREVLAAFRGLGLDARITRIKNEGSEH